jgi:hypothetical protein
MLRPCVDCGEISEAARCPQHARDPKPSRHERGYGNAWRDCRRGRDVVSPGALIAAAKTISLSTILRRRGSGTKPASRSPSTS